VYRSYSFGAEDASGSASASGEHRGRKASPSSPRIRKSAGADFSFSPERSGGGGEEMSPSDENIFDVLSRNRKKALEAAEKMLKGERKEEKCNACEQCNAMHVEDQVVVLLCHTVIPH
jgi:hypothetical protein